MGKGKEEEKKDDKKEEKKGGIMRNPFKRSVHKRDDKKEEDTSSANGQPTSPPSNNLTPAPPVSLANHYKKLLDAPTVVKPGRVSSSNYSPRAAPLEKLPTLRETKPDDRNTLLLKKLAQCKNVYDFSDPLKDLKSKEIKRGSLQECGDYIRDNKKILNEAVYAEIFGVFETNAFRTLGPPSSPNGAEFDPEEDEPALELSWPHLELVYELLLRVLESSEFDVSIAKKYLDGRFALRLLDLFDSEDPRERDFLKTILHRVYGHVLSIRAGIRKAINNIFFRFVYEEPGTFNGIPELLEILGSIINGFTVPLKDEHKVFLMRVLLPLHKVKSLALHHPQLAYCVIQFLEKDPSLTTSIVDGLLKFWPKVNSPKEVLFLTEMEEVLLVIDGEEFAHVKDMIFRRISKCIQSPHFQVAERTLYLFHQERVLALLNEHSDTLMPIVFPSLFKISKTHWNKNIQTLVFNALKIFMDMNMAVFEQCSQEYSAAKEMEKQRAVQRQEKWISVASLASSNPLSENVDTDAFEALPPSMKRQSSFRDTVSADEIRSASMEPPTTSRGNMRRKSILPVDRDLQDNLAHFQAHSLIPSSELEDPLSPQNGAPSS